MQPLEPSQCVLLNRRDVPVESSLRLVEPKSVGSILAGTIQSEFRRISIANQAPIGTWIAIRCSLGKAPGELWREKKDN